MINYLKRDITTVEYGIVVHGVNCQGVMGAGVALAIKNKWPVVFDEYVVYCNSVENKHDLLGTINKTAVKTDLIIVNAFTQFSYGRSSKPAADVKAVDRSLFLTSMVARSLNCPIVFMPKIGCGLGGLTWEADVEPIVQKTFGHQEVFVCEI